MRIVRVLTRLERWPISGAGAARGVTERAAIFVELHTADGHVGRGEAAPLPGLSRDTLGEAEEACDAFAAAPPAELAPTFDAIAAWVAPIGAPSARFAIETALSSAAAAHVGRPLAALLPAVTATLLPSSVVVDDADAAARAASTGARVLKLKVGPALDLDRITAISRAAPGASLRLDANRTWPRDRVVGYLAALAHLPIAYVEEPCRDAHELLAAALPLPIALDESLATLAEPDLARALASRHLAALILKPTLLGGLAPCLALARRGRPVVVTHTLESPLAQRAVATLTEHLRGGGSDVTSIARRWQLVEATPAFGAVAAVEGALDATLPIAVVHGRLGPQEAARQRALIAQAVPRPDDAALLFTSGSTGAARGVVLSRPALEAAAVATAAHLGWRDDDRWLLALSIAHAGGLGVVVRCHLAGRPTVIVDGGDRAALVAGLARATIASLVPTQLVQLLDDPAWRPPRGLRAIVLGGAAASPTLLAIAAARGVPFLVSYGLTETFGQVATAPLARVGDPGAPLVPLPGVELIAGRRDLPAPIRIRGPMLATRYLDGAPIAPELVTADLGFLEDGALHVVGRADDVIITGGENVHPSQVEAVLEGTPGVRAACVFGLPDPRWGMVIAAAIEIDATFELVTATAHWHDQLAPHARPRALAIADALPQRPTGKRDRRAASALATTPLQYR